MNCPRCEIEMKRVNVGRIELDTCNDCGGVWFDRNELRQVLDMGKIEITSSGLSRAMNTTIEREEAAGLSEMSCPRCSGPLVRYHYQGYSGILLDGCERQCGLWLDDGELRKIFEYMAEAAQPDPAKEAGLMTDLKKIKIEAREKHSKLLDSLVAMDDRPGPMRLFGSVLQGIYNIFR